eukprot:scaffold241964_cov51-Prasinocladus_malaysianus.AAC.2
MISQKELSAIDPGHRSASTSMYHFHFHLASPARHHTIAPLTSLTLLLGPGSVVADRRVHRSA